MGGEVLLDQRCYTYTCKYTVYVKGFFFLMLYSLIAITDGQNKMIENNK